GHVEMAVVVDPAGLDPHQRGHERGEEYRFEIATVQHGATLRWAAQRRPPPDSTCESPILSPPPVTLAEARTHIPEAGGLGSPQRERRGVPLAGTTAGETERSDLVMPSIVNLSWLPPIFAQASERLNLGELAGGATVWLAVTGLSRSGKTVFITSLVHNLLS